MLDGEPVNSRDRVLTTLEFEEPDCVPLTDHIYMPKSLEGILGKPGVRIDTPKEYIKVHHVLGLDLIAAFPAGFSLTQVNKNEFVDEWGIKWRDSDGMPWYVDGTLKKPEDIDSLTIPDPSEAKWYEPAKEIVRLAKEDLAIGAVVEGPFTRSWIPMGFQTFVKMLYTNPSLVNKFTDKVTRFFTELGKGFIDLGIEIIWMPDDMGYVNGPMMSPKLFHKFTFPYLKRMVNTFRKRGAKTLMHNDGQIMPIMDDLVEAGINGIHPLERAAGMSLETMKEKYSDKLTLIGNVNSKTVLQYGPFNMIKKQVLECLRMAAPGGGYILASDHSIHEGIPSANVKFMFETAKRFGKYPITQQ